MRKIVQRQDRNRHTLQTYRAGAVDDARLGILWGHGQRSFDKISVL